MSNLMQWFRDKQRHEQLLLIILAVVLLAWIVVTLVLNPLAEKQQQLVQRNQAASAVLDKVQQLAAEYKFLSKSGVRQSSSSNRSMSEIVNSSVASNGLVMRRYQPSSSGMAQVRFENMAFEKIIAWLHEIEFVHLLAVKDLSFTRGDGSGLVNMSVRLDQAR